MLGRNKRIWGLGAVRTPCLGTETLLEILEALLVSVTDLRDVTPCSLVGTTLQGFTFPIFRRPFFHIFFTLSVMFSYQDYCTFV